jgi:ectoine hydroxylase-related dioxygenase (phytanoyl-CoA dioxygenase family)
MTCWIALDDCDDEVGALQYAKASHKWPLLDIPPAVQSDDIHYQASLRLAAKAHGLVQPEIVNVQGVAGTCSFHDGLTWHGSAKNLSTGRSRRAIAAHFVSSQTRFIASPSSPLFGYYKKPDSDQLDETNFPIIWDGAGYRSASSRPRPYRQTMDCWNSLSEKRFVEE